MYVDWYVTGTIMNVFAVILSAMRVLSLQKTDAASLALVMLSRHVAGTSKYSRTLLLGLA